MGWIDIEDESPPAGSRVMVLIPFGMRVQDDTWTEKGWLNNREYVSHWQPIDAPGTYSEIMLRKRSTPAPPGEDVESDNWFSPAINEHFEMMAKLAATQMKLRLEAESRGDAAQESIDATRMAAYPSMLEALQDAVEVLERVGRDASRQKLAITKAMGDHEPIPEGVYYSAEDMNFYRSSDGRGLGVKFHSRWEGRKSEFPGE